VVWQDGVKIMGLLPGTNLTFLTSKMKLYYAHKEVWM